uniref:ATP-binding cassette sub-family B member 6 n=1 Tax=Plectus sambesii TaxID=2011161 RepID=A0A914X1U6_9BILA
MLLQRAIIVYMPLNNKKIVDSLTYRNSSTNKFDFRWDLIVFYAVLEFLNYNILYPVQRKLWAGVEQFTSREAQVKLYEHLLNLSLRFHVERKTGEVLKIMDRGISCVTGLVGNVLFYSFPELVDILFSAIFFTSTYDYRFVSITFVTMILYTAFSLLSTKWQKSQMEERIAADDDFSAMGVDSLLNFETVKYYNAEDYETRRYRTALEKSQTTELSQSAMYDLIYGVESIITGSGQLAGSLLCAYLIAQENGLTVGDYVLFATYISQLTSPLTVLEKIYREITESLVEMDKMFDIMEEKPEVCDHPDAVDYASNAGKIELKNVTFGYTKDQPVLKDVSFSVPPGKTFAFVGPSGSGKSTIIRLLFRFYDPDSGQILYDGQDITKVRQKSLRRHLGVVPQDTVLFNDTVSYNIRYGRVDASEEEMIEAAKAADIHKTIIGFTDGYDAKVGERGLKLSGGEKQRVAIARTILKSPSFVFLDEATSSLDTHTERNIHASLQQACRGKTTVVIAHRLSTIIGADEIIVLKEGRIAESGSHNELLAKEGIYFSMWMQQLTSEQLVTSEATLLEST